MKKRILLFFAVILVLNIVGCGTIRGIGEDIGTLGRWLTKGSQNVTNPDSAK